MSEDYNSVEVQLLLDPTIETNAARCFYAYSRDGQPNGEKIWIPRSEIRSIVKFPQSGKLPMCRVEIPEWLAERKGLI